MKACIRKNKLKKGNSYTVFIDYGNNSRKRESLQTFESKKEAEAYRTKMQSEINNNTYIKVPDITFAQAIDEWMENYVANNCEPNTAFGYSVINNRYLKPILGHIPFKIISSPSGIDIINDYYKYLRFDLSKETYIDSKKNKKYKKNLSYSTVDHHKAQISGIFTYFMQNKKLSTNICINTVIPKTDDEKMLDTVIDDIETYENNEIYEDDEFITPEQAVQILNLFMNTEMMVPVFLATLLGLRRSEIAGILENRVDIENHKLIIDGSRVRVRK